MTLVLSMMHRGHVPSMNRKADVKKDPRLEAGEGGIVLDKESSRVGEDQTRALGLDLLSPITTWWGEVSCCISSPGAERIGARALLASSRSSRSRTILVRVL